MPSINDAATPANNLTINADGSAAVRGVESGYGVVFSGEVAPSGSPGGRLTRPADVSPDSRLRIAQDAPLWDDCFNHTVFNTSKYLGAASTMAIALAAGFLQLNSAAATASGGVARAQTWRTFAMQGAAPLYFDLWAELSSSPVANCVIEFGFGLAAAAAAPTDGVFFRINGAGAFRGVVNYNGSETTTGGAVFADPAPNTLYHWLIAVYSDRVEFWQDDKLLGALDKTGLAAFPCMSGALPVLLRTYNAAATVSPPVVKIVRLSVTGGDLANNRGWGAAMAGMGLSAINAVDGQAAGQTANAVNSAAPASATLSNTAAGYTTLGGKFQFAAVAGLETDYALFGFQVPAAAAGQPGKNLMVTGIAIDLFNTGAAGAATLTLFEWALGMGASAVSLATADSATGGTRAPRRIGLGAQSFGASIAIGARADRDIAVSFETPLMAEAGSFVHVILRMPVGTATAAQVMRGNVAVKGYFE